MDSPLSHTYPAQTQSSEDRELRLWCPWCVFLGAPGLSSQLVMKAELRLGTEQLLRAN